MVVLISETQANSISTHQFDVSCLRQKKASPYGLSRETYDMEKGKANFLIPDEDGTCTRRILA